MYPEPKLFTLKRQQGSALVIAIFISVIMVLLVLSMSQILNKSKASIAYEVLGTRAFFAAQSGMERALSLLFPLNSVALTACPASLAPLTIAFNSISGLESCRVDVSCIPETNGTVTHFRLRSTGSCDGETIQTSRTIEMEVWQ
jgi:MSHA biogenesis protein MshP